LQGENLDLGTLTHQLVPLLEDWNASDFLQLPHIDDASAAHSLALRKAQPFVAQSCGTDIDIARVDAELWSIIVLPSASARQSASSLSTSTSLLLEPDLDEYHRPFTSW